MFSIPVRRFMLLGLTAVIVAVAAPNAHAQEGDGMFTRRKPKPVEATPAEKPAVPAGDLQPLVKRTGAWSIVLAAFRGEQQQQAAGEMLAKIAEQPELAGAFVDSRGGGRSTVVAVGRFADPSSSEALAKLQRVRSIKVVERIGGVEVEKRPFAGAFMAPPGELTNLGQLPEFNLVRAREQFGPKVEYTLQVAVYGRKDIIDQQKRNPTEEELKDARRAAEEAVVALRKEGELAFYFHGPRYSTVTIGVWSDSDFASRPAPGSGERARTENPDLTALRERFPNNLYNGAGLKVTDKRNQEQMQRSVIVRIPER